MRDRPGRAADPAVRAIEHELDLVGGAIATVASGHAPRVTVSGLRFGEQLIEPARHLARRAGVRIVPLWAAEDAGTDLAVEALDRDG